MQLIHKRQQIVTPSTYLRMSLALIVTMATGCSILGSDDDKFEGITVTNEIAEIISVDPNDWCLTEADSLCLPTDTTDAADTTIVVGSVLPITCYGFGPAYPNPSSDKVKVEYRVPDSGRVVVWIEAPSGVSPSRDTIVNNSFAAGVHMVEWNATNRKSAIYRFHFQAGGVHCVGDVQIK